MFSTVQHKFISALSYFGYASEPSEGLPEKIYKTLENQDFTAETPLHEYRIAPKPPSIWKRIASLGMSYLVFSSGQSRAQHRCTPWIPAVSFITLSESLTPIFIAGLSLFPDMVHAQSPDTTFFKAFGGANDDRVEAITTTPEGDLIVVGRTDSFGAGGDDVLLSKFSSNRTLLWANTLGGASGDYGRALTVTFERELVVAGYAGSFGAGSHDVLLSKFSSNGTLLWANTLGGAINDGGFALMVTLEGDLVVAGYTSSFGVGIHDVLLSKFSSNGTLLWANTLGGASDEEGHALTVTPEGDLVVAGTTGSFGVGSSDVLVSKFSSNGTFLWAKTLGGASNDYGFALTVTPEGDLVVAGYTFSFGAGSADVLLSKFSSNGTLLWANTLGGASSDVSLALTVTPEGDLVVAGTTGSFGVGNNDVLLSKFSSNGTFLWANTLGGASNDYSRALMSISEGDLIVSGHTASFGAGGNDLLLAKLNVQGVIENCSAWQSVTPEVQSITPNITDVTLNMTTDRPPWTSQDATSALNVADITSLMSQTTVCYEQSARNRTFTTSPQASLSNETPLPNSQNTARESGGVLSSPSMTRSSSVASMPSQSTYGITSSSIPTPSRGDTIPSITTFVYEESYPIIVNGETIGTFFFTGGSGQLDSDNVNTLNIQLDGDVEDGEMITLFTIPEGEEPLWEDIVLSNGSESGCVTTEGAFTTSEEEHSYQLIFQHESSECYTAALKLSAIPVLGGELL